LLRNTKKICLPELLRLIALFIWIILGSAACNTRIEGCLESNAENFDLNAELPCDGCCTYPSLGLTLTQKWDERNFNNADTLYDGLGQAYQIEDLRYFLTTWSWMNAAGDRFTVDSIDVDCEEASLRYTPDNVIIDTRKFGFTLGNIRDYPFMTNVQFFLGLTRDFSCLDPEDPAVPADLTEESPLWNPATSSLENIRLIIRRDITSDIRDTIFMSLSSDISLSYPLEFEKGFDMQLLLTVNYALWFADVDDINDLPTIEMSINSHFKESIFPTP
jgi:hypothetical protein